MFLSQSRTTSKRIENIAFERLSSCHEAELRPYVRMNWSLKMHSLAAFTSQAIDLPTQRSTLDAPKNCVVSVWHASSLVHSLIVLRWHPERFAQVRQAIERNDSGRVKSSTDTRNSNTQAIHMQSCCRSRPPLVQPAFLSRLDPRLRHDVARTTLTFKPLHSSPMIIPKA